jgi:toxin ParE1/3/4
VPQIRISPRAKSDLTEIWGYIADGSVTNVDAFIDKLYDTIQLLAKQSSAGRRRDELGPGILSFPFVRYIIFYRASPDAIEIARVLHGARDIHRIFGR